jgi:hypothetical protein
MKEELNSECNKEEKKKYEICKTKNKIEINIC